jgi:hypothetical protein
MAEASFDASVADQNSRAIRYNFNPPLNFPAGPRPIP